MKIQSVLDHMELAKPYIVSFIDVHPLDMLVAYDLASTIDPTVACIGHRLYFQSQECRSMFLLSYEGA